MGFFFFATFFYFRNLFVQVPKLGFKVEMSSFCSGKAVFAVVPGSALSFRVSCLSLRGAHYSLSDMMLLLRIGEALLDKQEAWKLASEALVQPL